MTFRLFRPPMFFRWLYPGALFRLRTGEKTLCLTFDDGPDPETTPELLGILRQSGIKAIFFCKGRAASEYPELIARIIDEGHLTGNHGYEHIDGWKSSSSAYLANIEQASQFIPGNYFRPPYGHLRLKQFLQIRRKFRIMLWDLMPYDFDASFGGEKSLEIMFKKARNGSVIVLHDRKGSSANRILPGFIRSAIQQGYKFILPEI
jgi:peptidoglycan-N-acetylglucosamine deacetylase